MRRLFGPRPTTSAEAVRLADVASPDVELRLVGGRVAQFVEKRTDGSVTTGTVTYVSDVPTQVVFTNPARTVTFPTASGAPAGWSAV